MEFFSAVFLFAFSSTVTPGPNNLMMLSSGVNHGIKRSLPHLLGICIGFPMMVVLVGLGFSVMFERFPLLHEVIKALGVAYLLYLAWLIARSSPSSLETGDSRPFSFLQAALFQWVNPKAWVMATGAIATYTTLDGNLYLQALLIGGVFFTVAFPCVGLWLVGGAGLKRFLQSARRQRLFNLTMAALLVSSIAPVLHGWFEPLWQQGGTFSVL